MTLPKVLAEAAPLDFHAFRVEGESYLLHVPTSAVFGISEIAREYFSARERGEDPAALWSRLRGSHGAASLESFASSSSDLLAFLTPYASRETVDRGGFLETLLDHHPRNLMLFVTSRCNLRCRYCYENLSLGKHRPPDMDPLLMRRVIDGFLERSADRPGVKITFFGGEPLLNFPVIREAVQYATGEAWARGKRVSFAITTNATLLSEEIIEFLVRHEFGVMASIDGDASAHDRHRVYPDGRGSHATVSRNIQRLLRRQLEASVLPVKLRATLTRAGEPGESVSRYFRENFPGARTMIGESMGTAELLHDWDVPLDEEDGDVFETFDRFTGQLESIAAGEAEEEFRGIVEGLEILHRKIRSLPEVPGFPLVCGVGRNMLGVASDGGLFPCHRFVGMEKYRIGHAADGGPDAAVLRAFYGKIIDCYRLHCRSCWARNLCQGDCPAYLARDDGEIGPPNEKRCSLLRRSYELRIWLYWKLEERRPDLFHRWFGGAKPA